MGKGVGKAAEKYVTTIFKDLVSALGTQDRAAEELDVDQGTISRIIATGRTSPTLLMQAAGLLGRPRDEVMMRMGYSVPEAEVEEPVRYGALEQVISLPKNKGRWSKATVDSVREWALDSEDDQDHLFWYKKLDEVEATLRKALPRRKVGPGEID